MMQFQEGVKVKYTGQGGDEHQLAEASTLLKMDQEYTVNFHHKQQAGQFELNHIFLDGIPAIGFFAGMFQTV